MSTSPVCNVCGSEEIREFNGRPNAFCGACGSYERTRVLKMFIDKNGVSSSHRVLHIAPEHGLSKYLKSKTSNYVPIDFDKSRYSHIPELYEFDLCDFSRYGELGSFDMIIHSHVIEHVKCNYSAVLLKLNALLKPGGRHLFCIPIYGRGFEEDLCVPVGEEAERRFGQDDHVRRFSKDDIHQTLGALFKLPEDYNLLDHFSEADLQNAAIPEIGWTGFTGATVFNFGLEDRLV